MYATSILRGARLDTIDRVWEKFGTSGVLTREDVDGLGVSNKKVLALRFDSTRVFEHEVDIDDFELAPPLSLQSIDQEIAVEIARKGIESAA